MFFLGAVGTLIGLVAEHCLPPGASLEQLPLRLGEKHAECTLPEILNKYLFARAHGYHPSC